MMRALLAALVTSSAILVVATSCHDRTAADVQSTDGGAGDGRAGRLHMIVDVTTEGAPKVIGTNEGTFVELRADATTPYPRVVEGIDTAKHLGGTKFMLVVSDKRNKPFSLPPFDPSGATPQADTVVLDKDGGITVNGTKVASVSAAALEGDASSKIIAFTAPKTATASAVADVIGELQKVGRPMTLSVAPN